MKSLVLILPLAGVVIGWLLSLGTKLFEFNIQDKRKLNKLLFYLLELRFHFQQAYLNRIEPDRIFDLFIKKIILRYNLQQEEESEIRTNLEPMRQQIEDGINEAIPSHGVPDYLMENIDEILIDLAEAFPILAYELSGQHNIKERLSDIDEYLDKTRIYTPDNPIDLKSLINPKVINSLIEELDESILHVSKKISRKTYKRSKEKLSFLMETNANALESEEVNEFIEEYIVEMEKIYGNGQPS